MSMYFGVRASSIALVILAAGCGPAPQSQMATFQNYVDRQAIETTLVRYSTGLDTFDADVYASAFTEDAEFTMDREDKVYRGRDEIRAIVTGMKTDRATRAADADPKNDPPPIMHHVLSNAVIDIVSADSARHHAYWMTVSGGPEMYSFRVAAQGRYEDELVKRDGQWLIHRRRIVE
jgi:3-phenylpropionate/cinnamic acid dioxygenase small subunit